MFVDGCTVDVAWVTERGTCQHKHTAGTSVSTHVLCVCLCEIMEDFDCVKNYGFTLTVEG